MMTVLVVSNPQKTKYFWGDISEIAGERLPLIERNLEGDCLCLVEGKGLVDVHNCDVVEVK